MLKNTLMNENINKEFKNISQGIIISTLKNNKSINIKKSININKIYIKKNKKETKPISALKLIKTNIYKTINKYLKNKSIFINYIKYFNLYWQSINNFILLEFSSLKIIQNFNVKLIINHILQFFTINNKKDIWKKTF
jgi:hypothetical protein